MATPWERFKQAARLEEPDQVPVAFEVDIGQVKAEMGHRVAVMGNVPPLDVAVREPPEVVAAWAKACLDKAAPGGGMILSVGGGVSPDTPARSLDAMLEAARTWSKPA